MNKKIEIKKIDEKIAALTKKRAELVREKDFFSIFNNHKYINIIQKYFEFKSTPSDTCDEATLFFKKEFLDNDNDLLFLFLAPDYDKKDISFYVGGRYLKKGDGTEDLLELFKEIVKDCEIEYKEHIKQAQAELRQQKFYKTILEDISEFGNEEGC